MGKREYTIIVNEDKENIVYKAVLPNDVYKTYIAGSERITGSKEEVMQYFEEKLSPSKMAIANSYYFGLIDEKVINETGINVKRTDEEVIVDGQSYYLHRGETSWDSALIIYLVNLFDRRLIMDHTDGRDGDKTQITMLREYLKNGKVVEPQGTAFICQLPEEVVDQIRRDMEKHAKINGYELKKDKETGDYIGMLRRVCEISEVYSPSEESIEDLEVELCSCGGEGLLIERHGVGHKYYVECNRCGVSTDKYIDSKLAVIVWNELCRNTGMSPKKCMQDNPHTAGTNMSQDRYEHLFHTARDLVGKCDTSTLLTDDEAKQLVANEFGFEINRIEILWEAEVDVSKSGERNGSLKKKDRPPAYVATDWNYVRFNIHTAPAEWHYEMINAQLYPIYM